MGVRRPVLALRRVHLRALGLNAGGGRLLRELQLEEAGLQGAGALPPLVARAAEAGVGVLVT